MSDKIHALKVPVFHPFTVQEYDHPCGHISCFGSVRAIPQEQFDSPIDYSYRHPVNRMKVDWMCARCVYGKKVSP